MDSIISSVIGGVIEGYFSIFFKNFKKEDFRLNTGTSNTSTTLHNLEINKDVVREILGIPSLDVTKMSINKLHISLQPTKVMNIPIVIHVERLDCLLSEPWTALTPIPTVLEDFFRKFLVKGKSSYGLPEKIIDGFTIMVDHIHIEVDTCGKYKVQENGEWTPPPLFIDLKGVTLRTVNDRWEVVDLGVARDYNKNLQQIYVFKTLNVDSFRCTIHDEEDKEIALVANIPIRAQVVLRKELNNELNGISVELILDHFHSTLKMDEFYHLANLVKGVASCFGRRDKPPKTPIKIPHPAKIIGVQIRSFSLVVLEAEGTGMELAAKDIRLGNSWGKQAKENEKKVEFCLGSIYLREFFRRTGPSNHLIVDSDRDRNFVNPFVDIKPIQRNFHPTYQSYTTDKPLLYVQGKIGDMPAFDVIMMMNPILFTLRPETVNAIVALVSKAAPHIEKIQQLHSVKPEGVELENIIVQEGKSPLEETFHLRATIRHVCFAFPSSQTSDYVKVCLNIANTTVISHPNLPDSKRLFQSGLGSLTTFPGAEDDLVIKRESILASAINLHQVKFHFEAEFEWTVQFDPDATPQRALHMPKNNLDIVVSLGHHKIIEGQPKPKLEPLLTQIAMGISELNGCLTQLQYQAILSRIDQVMLLIPVIQKIGSAGTNIEKPKTSTLFLLKIENGEWKLCNDFTTKGGDENIELLAGLKFSGIEVCGESSVGRQVAKVLVHNVGVAALGTVQSESQLFNPNDFIKTGSPAPLFSLRFKNIQHEPGELLEEGEVVEETAASTVRKYLGNRAFYDGERSNIDIRLTSLHSGINPNPACDILNFFLKSDINIQSLIARLRQAKADLTKNLEDLDISAMASDMAAEFKVDHFVESIRHSLDIDVKVDITDTRIFLVQDNISDGSAVQGNIALEIKRILFDRHVINKYKHVSLARIDSVDISCNKEENKTISSQAIFTPVSCKFESQREWFTETKEWNMEVDGFFDKINLEVTPSHARVFMDVIHGVKIENVRKVVNSIGDYVSKVKTQLPSIAEQLKDAARESLGGPSSSGGLEPSSVSIVIDENLLEVNSVAENAEQLAGWLQKAKNQAEEGRIAFNSLNASMASLEERTGEADILGCAIKKGPLKMVSGRKIIQRYAAISKNGSLFVFSDAKGGKALAEMKIDGSTQLAMIDKISCGFQLARQGNLILLSAPDDMEMVGWTNTILKLQVAGVSDYADQTMDPISQAKHSVEEAIMYANRIAEAAEQLKDQTKLLAHISALEALVKEKDEKIASLAN